MSQKLESARKIGSWRRIVKVLLKNDYWCEGLSFSKPKGEIEKHIDVVSCYDERLCTLIDVVKKLNDAIKEDPSLGKGFQIGHSYFLQKGVTAEEIVTYELIPLLEEYWFDNGTKLQEWTEHLKKWTEKLESQ